jgi:transcriptional regulator with GAF, ATPase, and Fis domain
MAKELDNPKLLHSVNTFSTFFLYWQGRFREAIQSYEKSVTEIEKFPEGKFSLLAAVTVGVCYTQIGQVTQGLGMLDGILAHARKKGDQYLAAYAGAAIGATMLDIRRMEDALKYLECSVKDAIQTHNKWVEIMGSLMLAFAYYLNNENKRSIAYLRKFLQHSNQVHVSVRPYSYLMELCWAMEQGKVPHLSGLSLEKETHQMISSENVFMKGVGYRFQALLQRREGLGIERVIESLNLSLRWLDESGHQIEIAQSQLELARQYFLLGDSGNAKEMVLLASKILFSFNEELVPDDLRSLIKEPLHRETLLNEILKLGQEIVTIRDNKDLAQHIISTVNRLTGAERGAIFILDGNSSSPRLRLRASKNITSEQIAHSSFNSSMKMIEEVANGGKGLIQEGNSVMALDLHSDEIIRSCICVPMILRDKVVGVLYHDNRLLSSAFKESDLEFLAYFAALAAFALDNAQAYEEIQMLNQKLKEENLYYEEQHLESLHIEDIVGESPAIKRVLALVDQVAKTDTTILIIGETGVGKELVARAIHRHSFRRDKPFIRVQCSALPEGLIPSELFGHEKGAFTGAINRRTGRFELADGGTLFLDEIGDLPREVQVRLLRVLQSKEFERVGGSETLHSDFRLVAATNCNLEEEVKASRFRADLYFRLNVFPIFVPPLRERKDDIPILVRYFISIYGTKTGKTFDRIPEEEMSKLIQYDWPGNIRELENIIERGTILTHGPTFYVPKLSIDSLEFGLQKEHLTLRENERHHIESALLKTGWKIRGPGGAAELLEIHPSTLAFKMKKLGVQRPEHFSKRRSAMHSISGYQKG